MSERAVVVRLVVGIAQSLIGTIGAVVFAVSAVMVWGVPPLPIIVGCGVAGVVGGLAQGAVIVVDRLDRVSPDA